MMDDGEVGGSSPGRVKKFLFSTSSRLVLGPNQPPPRIVARQRLGKHVPTGMNIHATIDELLDVSFSVWCTLYKGKLAITSSQNFLFMILLGKLNTFISLYS
jgi:hypothetical protein